MTLDLRDCRKRILVGPHRIDGLLSSSRNVVVVAIAFIGTVRSVIRAFQLGKIYVLTWNVLNGRIRRFAERQSVARIGHHAAGDGYDNASGIALNGNRMIRTRPLDLFFFHVGSPFLRMLLSPSTRRFLPAVYPPTRATQFSPLTPRRIRALGLLSRNRCRSAPWAPRSARSPLQFLRPPLWEILLPTPPYAEAWACRPKATGRFG